MVDMENRRGQLYGHDSLGIAAADAWAGPPALFCSPRARAMAAPDDKAKRPWRDRRALLRISFDIEMRCFYSMNLGVVLVF
jgi:hypothetical protein